MNKLDEAIRNLTDYINSLNRSGKNPKNILKSYVLPELERLVR